MRPKRRRRGRKILPRAASIAGTEPAARKPEKPLFYWVFRDGTGFADRSAWKCGRAARHLSEFCHAACPWRRVGRAGRRSIADLVDRRPRRHRPASTRARQTRSRSPVRPRLQPHRFGCAGHRACSCGVAQISSATAIEPERLLGRRRASRSTGADGTNRAPTALADGDGRSARMRDARSIASRASSVRSATPPQADRPVLQARQRAVVRNAMTSAMTSLDVAALVAIGQRLRQPRLRRYPKRSFHAGSAPGKGSAVAA